MPFENMKKLPIKDIISDPATYITNPGTLTVNLTDFVVSVHDGFTPGGLPIGGGPGGTVTWNSIVGKPTFATVATSGAYTDLSGKPVLSPVATGGTLAATSITGLAPVATSGLYSALTGAPTLSAVATSGAYVDLTGKPTFATVATTGAYADLTGAPALAPVATSGLYSALTGTPTLATVATTGAYDDLTGSPVLAAVATSGDYTDLTGSPVLAPVATTGAYSDLTGTPAAPESTLLPQPTHRLRVSNVAIVGADPMAANGSEAAPFATVQAAVDYATTAYPVTINSGVHVAIEIDPGIYPDAVTITRPLTHLIGVAGRDKATALIGGVTFNPNVTFQSVGNSTISMKDIYVNAPINVDALSFTGTSQFTFHGSELAIASSGTGDCLSQDNTSVGGTKLFFYDTDIIGNQTTGLAINVSNSYFFTMQQTNIDMGSAATGISITDGGTTFSNVFIDGGNATLMSLQGNNVMTLVNSFIQGSGANGTGVQLGATATLLCSQNTFSIADGTGFVVNGVTGSTFGQSFNTILPGKNIKVAAAMTIVELETSFTPV